MAPNTSTIPIIENMSSSTPSNLENMAIPAPPRPAVEVAGISLWEGELEDSEEIAAEFRREVHRVSGTGAARTVYEVVRLELRDGPRALSS